MRLTFFLFLFVLVVPLKAQEKVITVASDEWCPYICNDQDSPGYIVELLKEIAQNNDLKLKFSYISLARALALTNTNKVDIVLALTPDHFANLNLQQSKLPFGTSIYELYVNSQDTWKYQSVTDLERYLQQGKLLGIISGYEYGEVLSTVLEKYKPNVYKATGDSPLANLIKMVNLKRLDLLLDSRAPIQYELKRAPDYKINYAGTEGEPVSLFLGFSPFVDKSIIDTFDNGLIEMRKSGKLAEILAKYAMKDWHEELTSKIQ